MLRLPVAPVFIGIVIALTAIAFAACGGDDSAPSSETSDGSTPAAGPTVVFSGDTEAKERITRADRQGPATLESATGTDAGSHSSVSFVFTSLVPDFNVQYVDEPISCGSGEPLDIEGDAFLQVRFTPSLAHNDLGETTFALPDEFSANLPAILEIQQSCDFEGELTFVFGLDEEADFKVNYLTAPIGNVETIVINVRNP